MTRLLPLRACLAALLTLTLAGQALAVDPPARKPDLADAVAGTYAGDVISDSKGSSRSGVTLTVERTAPNTVRINSDYSRLPVVTVRLTRAMSQILQRDGDTVFLYDPTKSPPRLDVSFLQEVSWSGEKR